jgi:Leucine rich repeat
MLGNERFVFETPNVIDPGDLPPSRPSREQDDGSDLKGTESSTNLHFKSKNYQRIQSPGSRDDYNQARESAARLLRDIADLELNPTTPTQTIYDPYDDDDDGSPYVEDHSLPHRTARKQQSRLHAVSLLKNETQPLSLQRTVKLREGESSQNLLRKRILRCLQPYLIWIGLATIAIILVFSSMAFVKSMQQKRTQQLQTDDNNKPKGKYALESSVRFQNLVRLLSEGGISLSPDLQTRDTPQYRAAYWIANKDLEQREFSDPLTIGNDPHRVIQRYILALLYFATGGPDHWIKTLDFITATDECAWSQDLTMPNFISGRYNVGVGCDTNLQVRSLFLPENGLIGKLPNEIRFLNRINLISFPLNDLSGAIPEGLSEMQDLLYLDLNYNSFTGSIPDFMGDFGRLQVLGLSNNQFGGSVPNSLGTLPSIKTLSLDDALTGSIDFVRHLDNLEYLYLDRNKFTSHLNDTLFESLDYLREIDLSDNQLKGEVDLSLLLEHEFLRVVDLSNNNFTGQFPDTVNSDNNLNHLSLRGNKFDGQISSSTISSLAKLTHLDLQWNDYSGKLPYDLESISGLNLLFLGGNRFTPYVPQLALLSNLRQLSLTDMNLTKFPDWLDSLTKLELLDVSYNNLSGSIDEGAWNLPNLKYLMLNDNKLSGEIPGNQNETKKLMFLALHHNALSGDANHVCEISRSLIEITTDCDLKCDKTCCKNCCASNTPNCFNDEVEDVMFGHDGAWQLKYSKSSFSFDPSILDEASLFKIVTTGSP